MHKYLLLVAMCASLGCDSSKTPDAQPTAPTEAAETKPEEAAEAKPEEGEAKPEPAAAKAPAEATGPLSGPEGLTAWKAELQSALNQKKADEAKKLIKVLDPSFDTNLLTAAFEQKVESFEGQLDDTPAKEIVIQVRQHGDVIGHGEREDFYYVGVVAEVDGKRKLVGSIVRPKLLVCEFAEGSGLRFGFSGKKAKSPNMWVVEQDVLSCGTLINVEYKKVEYRLKDGALVTKTVKPPKSVEYDRMEYIRDGE